MFWILLGLIAVIFTGFLLFHVAKKTSVLCAVGIILIVVVFTLSGLLMARSSAKPGKKIFDIKARQFAYEPPIIKVNKGDTVVLRLTSKDVTHGFYLDGYGINVEIKPHGHGGAGHDDGVEPEAHGNEKEAAEGHDDKGEAKLHGQGEEGSGHEDTKEVVTEVSFLADKVGRFGFRCSKPCGSLHPFMVGKFIVEPNYLYSGSLGLTIGLTLSTLIYLLARKEKSHETKD